MGVTGEALGVTGEALGVTGEALGVTGEALGVTGRHWELLGCPHSCVGVEEEAAAEIDLYHCPQCAVLRGPSVRHTWAHLGQGQTPPVSPTPQTPSGPPEPQFFAPSPVYPSLESDEDDPALKSLPKKKKVTDDAPWSPKARVTPSLPRQSRPVREGTRVASVETGLAAAAAKLAQQVNWEHWEGLGGTGGNWEGWFGVWGAPKAAAQEGPGQEPPQDPPYPPSLADHEYTARPGGPGPPPGAQPGRAPTPMAPGVFLSQRRGNPSTGPPTHGKRPRKGLATAKQRLGRILKIHRNGKLLL
uniref:PHD finger protein 8 n=1 Tax=Catharus ustulatus TaxID=91951 RepID=A0A8C3V1I4_CATUS